jgi:hypothetical protein
MNNIFNFFKTNISSSSPPPPFVQQQQQQQSLNFEPGVDNLNNNNNDDIFASSPPPPYQSKAKKSTARVSRIQLEKDKDKDKDLVAVIVTIFEGSSYDPIYQQTPQHSPDGRISVFAVPISIVKQVQLAICGLANDHDQEDQVFKEMITEIQMVEPESVVFNWECCSNCYETCIDGISSEDFLEFLAVVIERKHMAMYSDFSLKSLIGVWKACADDRILARLGNCPLVNLGVFSNDFHLNFIPSVLKECDSAQLQKVGELSENGQAHVHAMSSTILYSVDRSVLQRNSAKYTAEILTIVSKIQGGQSPQCKEHTLNLGEHRGAAGHVLLKFPDKGMILCSSGHWIELAKLDASINTVILQAEKEYGVEYAQKFKTEYDSAPQARKSAMIQSEASKIVFQSAPQKYSKKK